MGMDSNEALKTAARWSEFRPEKLACFVIDKTAALRRLEGVTGRVIVLYGDTPFIAPETLEKLAASPACVTVLGFHTDSRPKRYGRLVMDGDALLRIVEYKDATEAERAITLINSGVVYFPMINGGVATGCGRRAQRRLTHTDRSSR